MIAIIPEQVIGTPRNADQHRPEYPGEWVSQNHQLSVDTCALPADGYFRADFLSVSDLSVPNNDRVLSKVLPPTRLYLGGTNNPSKKAPRKKRTNAKPSVTTTYKGSR